MNLQVFPDHLLEYLLEFLDDRTLNQWLAVNKKWLSKRGEIWKKRFSLFFNPSCVNWEDEQDLEFEVPLRAQKKFGDNLTFINPSSFAWCYWLQRFRARTEWIPNRINKLKKYKETNYEEIKNFEQRNLLIKILEMLRYNFPKLPGIFEGHRTYNSAPEADYWDTTVVDNELLIRWTGHYGPGNSPEHYTILELYPVDGRKVLGYFVHYADRVVDRIEWIVSIENLAYKFEEIANLFLKESFYVGSMSSDNPWYGDINPVCMHITDQYVFEANNRKKTWYLLEHQILNRAKNTCVPQKKDEKIIKHLDSLMKNLSPNVPEDEREQPSFRFTRNSYKVQKKDPKVQKKSDRRSISKTNEIAILRSSRRIVNFLMFFKLKPYIKANFLYPGYYTDDSNHYPGIRQLVFAWGWWTKNLRNYRKFFELVPFHKFSTSDSHHNLWPQFIIYRCLFIAEHVVDLVLSIIKLKKGDIDEKQHQEDRNKLKEILVTKFDFMVTEVDEFFNNLDNPKN